MNNSSRLIDLTLWEINVFAKGYILPDLDSDVKNIRVDVIPQDNQGYKSAVINVYGRIDNANQYLDGDNYLDGNTYLKGNK